MQISVAIKGKSHEFSAERDERLLHAGLRQGVPLAYECATGTCGSCRAVLSSGSVVCMWPEAPGLAENKRRPAEILLCQCAAQSDCSLHAEGLPATRYQPRTLPTYAVGKIAAIRPLTHDVAMIVVALDDPLVFEAGQFMLVSHEDISGWRAYSLVEGGCPTRTATFIVKRKPGGGMTNWLFGDDRTGAPIRLFGPLGAATFRPESDAGMLFLAGGSGLSMVLSILTKATQTKHLDRQRAQVIFGVRTEKDVFLLDRLAEFAERERAEVTVALSDEKTVRTRRSEFPSLTFMSGFVHEVAERCVPPGTANTVAFLAGPPPMIDASLRFLLTKAKIPPSRIRYDKFS